MNKKTVIYILGCVLVFVSAFMLLPWFVSLIYSEETGKYFLYTAIAGFVLGRIMTWKKQMCIRDRQCTDRRTCREPSFDKTLGRDRRLCTFFECNEHW